MKALYQLFTLAYCGAALAAAAADEPRQEPVDTNIVVDLQMVEMPRETALPLVRELMEKTKTEAAVARLQEMLDKGTATLIGWPMVTTHSGARGVFEAIDELRYATEYMFGSNDIYLTTEPGKTEDAIKQISPDFTAREFSGAPTAFETRNTGVTLEVEPVLSADGKLIMLNLVPQHVRLKRMNKVGLEHEKTHDKVFVEQPEFDTLKTTTSLTVKGGEHVFLGVYPASDLPDHLEIFILRAEARKVQ